MDDYWILVSFEAHLVKRRCLLSSALLIQDPSSIRSSYFVDDVQPIKIVRCAMVDAKSYLNDLRWVMHCLSSLGMTLP